MTRCHGRELQPRDGGAEAPGRHGEVARQQVHTVVSIHCIEGQTVYWLEKSNNLACSKIYDPESLNNNVTHNVNKSFQLLPYHRYFLRLVEETC